MCASAKQSGESVASPHQNCQWQGHDTYTDSGHRERGLSCQDRAAYFRVFNFSYAQLEHELWPSDLCWDHFVYGIALREPVELIHSELNYRTIHYPKDANKRSALDDLRRKMEAPGPAGEDQAPMWKFMDNIQTRLIADALSVPAGGINMTHVRRARRRLAKFRVVVRVVDLDDWLRRRRVFELLGWPDPGYNDRGSLGPNANRVHQDFAHIHDSEIRWLRHVNRFDTALYNAIPSLEVEGDERLFR